MDDISPEVKAISDKAADDASMVLALVVEGLQAEKAGDMVSCELSVTYLHDFVDALDEVRMRATLFEIAHVLVHELAAKHGGLDALVAAFADPNAAVFVGESIA